MTKDKQGVGIAGAMDHKVEEYAFYCNWCGKGMETPMVAAGGPLRFWCSKECLLEERKDQS